jgi:GH24 family phage-related lysozyme (muramidase)
MNIANVQLRLRKFEGCTDFMYRCTGGEVTVGVGHAIQKPADASAFSWTVNGAPAALAQVNADYKAIEAAQTGLAARKYQPMTRCRLDNAQIDRLLAADVQKFENLLRAEFPDWDRLPEPAQEALFDMAFNLGITGLVKKFPKMMAAVRSRNWAVAAAECHRNGIQEERNRETAELFHQAGRSTAVA